MTVESTSLSEAALPFYFGFDVGGTTIKVGLIDDKGRSLAATSFPTADHLGPANAVERMKRQADQCLEKLGLTWDQIAGIGLGTPGTMDIQGGKILEPPNLPGWRHFPIRDALQSECDGKPVTYANDANAAAYGEYWVGSARDYSSLVMLTLGTGVGGGIIIGELSVDGEHSHGSECGHIVVDSSDAARICSCGQPGHLEAYASATAVVKRTMEALESGRDSSLNQRLAEGEALSALMVAQEADQGDPLCNEIVLDTAAYLGRGLVSVAHIINPAIVLFGGAMNFGGRQEKLGRQFLQRIRETFAKLAFPVVAEKTVIDFASLGGNAGYIGAAGLARRDRIKDASGNL